MRWIIVLAVVGLGAAAFAGAYVTGLVPLGQGMACGSVETGSVTLPNASGRIDHMSYDPNSKTLFVAAYGNGSLAAVNVTSGRFEKDIGGLSDPQGVLYAQSSDQVYVSNGGTGTVDVLDPTTLAKVANISLASDADNMRYDQVSGLVYVGYGQGGIAVVNSSTRQVVWTLPLAGHPEGFQIDGQSKTIYVNVPTSGYVAIGNLTSRSVSERWPLVNASGNYPMAFDNGHGRLFVGVRAPAELLVYDTATGRVVASVGISQDPDDIYYDSSIGCVFITSGSGYLTAVREDDPSHFSVVQEVQTSPGARTSLLVPQLGVLYVAAPASGSSPARVIEYKVA